MIYLASPYMVGDAEKAGEKELMEARYRSAMLHAAELQKEGKFCISPIAHWHRPAGLFSLPKKAEFWLDYNKDLLIRCNKMKILMLPGWEESTGVTAEQEFAKEQNINYDFREPTTDELARQQRMLKQCKKLA